MLQFKTFLKKKKKKSTTVFLKIKTSLPNGPYSIHISHTLKVEKKKKKGQCFAASIETLLMHTNVLFVYESVIT